jgi:hypothetical protein
LAIASSFTSFRIGCGVLDDSYPDQATLLMALTTSAYASADGKRELLKPSPYRMLISHPERGRRLFLDRLMRFAKPHPASQEQERWIPLDVFAGDDSGLWSICLIFISHMEYVRGGHRP